ncbi:DUF3237 domain-containing protein [Vannielia litorea]|uniref:DUF3237 domain-containing protein n=1 Tax=Vannielia litorea TaxID=1217970 RepID=UPI001C9516A0|nr:DUF3237 domain-containing protein [Vannielia litorea]MBY6048987.1 DUF3237 domain-containing protein [Vannielia litorea]MBY6076401.1 DUF3237 domain-containing protein [Vannielia litorea]
MSQFDTIAPPRLGHRLLWEALVDVEEMRSLGQGPTGERRIVPITGGEFRGGPGLEGFYGTVLAGGADRQLVRADGSKELDALYEMEVADGTLLTIRNRVIIDESLPGPRYALSRIEVRAPEGPWEWLGRRLIVGTLQSARPERAAVLIRGWEMTSA